MGRKRQVSCAMQMFAVVALVGLASGGYAQTLVDPLWLVERMDEPDVVLLHVGTPAGYANGHLPNARLITLADVSAPESLPGANEGGRNSNDQLMFEIKEVASLTASLESLGITNRSEIVLYGEADQPLPSTTRVAFVLDYLGLGDNVHLLNGGTNAWLTAGYELSGSSPAIPSAGSLRVQANDDLLADARDVAEVAQRAEFKLIDARLPMYYNGEEESFGGFGHIPGAISLPFDSLVDNSGQFDEEQLTEAFQGAGINQGDNLIVYCHVGMRASQAVFAAKLLGFDVQLYDGSFQDWVAGNRGGTEIVD